jgi:hypothetical protein
MKNMKGQDEFLAYLYPMLKTVFFKPIDNTPLVLFRWLFGLLIFLESVGAIFTGWVRVNMVEPSYSFTFIGFEFLQVLLGPQMYIFYAIMGLFGLMEMLGWYYRFSMAAFTVMWSVTYFMQKTSYNNHYYLLMLICILMCLIPAHHYGSLDVRFQRVKQRLYMHNWHRWSLILMMGIAYVYGSIAKIYPDWLDATFIRRAFTNRYDTPWLNSIFSNSEFHYFISYSGIAFDLLIVPALLWRKTRWFAIIASFGFHLFNSAVFHIGIFPYLSLAFILFFFPPATIRKKLLPGKPPLFKNKVIVPSNGRLIQIFLCFFFLIQLILPIRHHFIDSNVYWSDEGHRMSWRMMLRSKSGYISYKVIDKETGDRLSGSTKDFLTPKQRRRLATHPDMIWQFAQHLEQHYEKEGKEAAVYAFTRVGLNGREKQQLVDPTVDLAGVNWNYCTSQPWITDFSFEKNPEDR